MAMKLKLDESGNVVVKNGKPIYVWDDGKEFEADVPGMYSKITDLNKEAATHRSKAEELATSLKAFEGVDPNDLDAILDAIEEVGGLDGLTKLKAGKNVDVEAIKKQITEVYEGKLKEKDQIVQTKDGEIRTLLVSNGFSSSKFVAEKLIIPADIVEATFGKNFRVEDGRVVAYLGENKILSREKPGEIASIDEALQVIVDSYPMKDRIMKASGGGSGAPGGGSGGAGGANQISRAGFNALSPAAQQQHISGGGTVADQT